MRIIEEIKEKAKQNIKTIILPESMDNRVLEAAKICVKEKIAKIIIIGNKEEISKKIDVSNIEIIDQNTFNQFEQFVCDLYELRKHKGMTKEEARRLMLEDNMYFACMLVHEGYADGIVSGACHSTSNTLRPALQIIKTKETSKLVSSFFLVCVPNCDYGYNGTFIFGDAGLEQNPTPEKLASIAIDSANSFENLIGVKSVTALLSHSTKGSAKHADVDKVIEATKLAQEWAPELNIDGELQLDAAIDKDVAAFKAPNSNVAGHANVLIFPDLDAGNIGYKLVQRLAKAEAYGPITQGIRKTVNDLSRGCSVDDIVGVIAITCVQNS